MTDLTRKKIKQKLEAEIKFYDKEIQRSQQNIEHINDEIDLERIKKEKEKRQRELQQVSNNTE